MKQAKKILSKNGSQMLSARSAATRLSCATDYIGKLCRDGKLSGTQVNGAWFVYEESLDSFESLRQEARSARSEELSFLRKQELSNNGFIPKKETPIASPFFNLVLIKVAATSAFIGFIFVASVSLSSLLRTAPYISLGASIGELNSPFFAQQSLNLPIPSATIFGKIFDSLFVSRVNFEAKVKPVVQLQQEPFPAASSATDNGIISAALSASSSKVQYAIYPVVERTVEKIIIENGISPELMTSIIKELAAGKDGAIQYNDNGRFAASSTALVWNDKTGTFTVSGALNADTLCLRGVCLTKSQLQSLISSSTTASTP